MSIAEFAESIKEITAEYGSNEAELRQSGMSLASYVETALRDNDPAFKLTPEERKFCDEFQRREWGGTYEQSFSKASSK